MGVPTAIPQRGTSKVLSDDLERVIIVLTRPFAPALQAGAKEFIGLHEVEGDLVQERHVLDNDTIAHASLSFTERHVQHPIDRDHRA